jgi:GT2 family glycosyltransferase
MKSVYIGVCKTRDDERFIESFRNFTDSIVDKYSVCQTVVRDMFLPDAQNKIAKQFLDSGYDYLLLLDDDHWGHTKEMLECLINANTFVATMKTYIRKYPYNVAAWDKVGHNALVPIEKANGYRECDLTGFPMTLVSRGTFDLLEQPYFRPLEAEGRTWNSDVDFFERLALKGVKPVVCYQHTLNHDKITEDNVYEYRMKEKDQDNNIAWFRILQEQEQLQGA